MEFPTEVFGRVVAGAEWQRKTMYNRSARVHTSDPAKVVASEHGLSEANVADLNLEAVAEFAVGYQYPAQPVKLLRPRLLRYAPGGFVTRHADAPPPDATHRLIFLPPRTAGAWEGGELWVDDMDFNQDSTHWIVVIVPFGAPHEVTPVTTGTRYAVLADVALTGAPVGADYSSEELDDIGYSLYD